MAALKFLKGALIIYHFLCWSLFFLREHNLKIKWKRAFKILLITNY